jgi:hypothetical protein
MLDTLIGVFFIVAGVTGFVFQWPQKLVLKSRDFIINIYSIFLRREYVEKQYESGASLYAALMPVSLILFGIVVLVG